MNWLAGGLLVSFFILANTQSLPSKKDLELKVRELLTGNSDLIPKFVRMVYHDCVGGCDGCIDLSSSDNAGLEGTVSLAQQFRTNNAPGLSQADVNVLLGIVAVQFAVEQIGNNKTINIEFRVGRKDCVDGTIQEPVPHGERLDTISFLTQAFSLTQTEAVALMGAHSLGRCHLENSGFVGRWDLHEFQLDNGYFRNLVASGWIAQRQNNDRATSTQWVKSGTDFVMLHADMVLLKRFTTSGTFDTPSCTFNRCRAAATSRTVNNFANNEDLFLSTFQSAFTKMINGDGIGLTPLE